MARLRKDPTANERGKFLEVALRGLVVVSLDAQCSTSETEYIDAALTIVALEIPSCNARPGHTWRYDPAAHHTLEPENTRPPAI